MPRKKVKKELQYDDISSVSGESELDQLSLKEHELIGLTELCTFSFHLISRKRKTFI